MTEIRKEIGSLTGKKYKPGMLFKFELAIPMAGAEKFAMLVDHDGLHESNVSSMRALADEGKAPYCVNIGVKPGRMVLPDGTVRDMRMNSYDLFDREYSDFLVYELIPYIAEEYSLNFYENADMRMVSGGSSGGISAFAIAWFHPEYFHRVYMSSPSFLSMGRGNELPYLIRKYETKPLRVYEEISEEEPNDYFGWSRGIDEETAKGLQFAKYDFECKYFPGEGHCSRYNNEESAYERNEWLWRDWDTKPIIAPANSKRVDRVIPQGSKWEECSDFPEAAEVTVPEELSSYGKVVLSNDKIAYYCANKNEDIVYSHMNYGELSSEKRLLHATLHTIPRFEPKGAIDMAVSRTDRLFVLTSIGVQCVRSYGLVDVMLDLPDGATPLEIAVTDKLYVRTEAGIYCRELCSDCVTDSEEKRKNISYYD